jgi:hypothetical protein
MTGKSAKLDSKTHRAEVIEEMGNSKSLGSLGMTQGSGATIAPGTRKARPPGRKAFTLVNFGTPSDSFSFPPEFKPWKASRIVSLEPTRTAN